MSRDAAPLLPLNDEPPLCHFARLDPAGRGLGALGLDLVVDLAQVQVVPSAVSTRLAAALGVSHAIPHAPNGHGVTGDRLVGLVGHEHR